MVSKLAALGKAVDWSCVLRIAAGAVIGRPHVARAMVEQGLASHVGEVFSKYLHNDGPAYVKGTELSPAEAIRLIHSVGGVAVREGGKRGSKGGQGLR